MSNDDLSRQSELVIVNAVCRVWDTQLLVVVEKDDLEVALADCERLEKTFHIIHSV